MNHKIFDRDDLAAGQQSAQLLVKSVSVRGVLSRKQAEATSKKKESKG